MRAPNAMLGLFAMGLSAVAYAEPPDVGAPAPAFELPDQTGATRRLADYRDRWLVLYFYPRDDTPGCTKQACSFRDDIARLRAADAEVVGVSVDSVESHAEFAAKHTLPFPLLADTEGTLADAYGALRTLGPIRMARRHTFLIDPQGRIAARFLDVDAERNSAQVLAALADLQKPASVP